MLVNPAFRRIALLLGEESVEKLQKTSVIVFGLGGVGSRAAEALLRSGIGHITIADNDTVCESNINRQIEALPSTLGLPKSAALLRRLGDINPACDIRAFNQVFSRETAPFFEIEKADFVIDAIDSLPEKIDLIETCCAASKPVLFSSMGMAARLDPTRIKTDDIWKSHGCPLARLVRQGLKKRGFNGHFRVVYSDEAPLRASGSGEDSVINTVNGRKKINGSLVSVTAAAGMVLASLVIRATVEDGGDNFNG